MKCFAINIVLSRCKVRTAQTDGYHTQRHLSVKRTAVRLPLHKLLPGLKLVWSFSYIIVSVDQLLTCVGAVTAAMYRVLVTLDLPASVLARLTASCEVTRVAGGLGLVASVAAATREQGGHQLLLCSSFDTVDLALLEAAGPRLEAVVTVSAGYNHVDTALLARRGLVLATTPGVLEDSVAEVGVALVLDCVRGVRRQANLVSRGQWPASTDLFRFAARSQQ